MNEYPHPAFGTPQKDGTVFAGLSADNSQFIYTLPRSGGLARLFNKLAGGARHVRALNVAKAGGHGDWRLPTKEEQAALKHGTAETRRNKTPVSMYIGFTKAAIEKDIARRKSYQYADTRAVRAVPRPYEYTEEKIEKDRAAHKQSIDRLLGRLQAYNEEREEEAPPPPAVPDEPSIAEERQAALKKIRRGHGPKPQ